MKKSSAMQINLAISVPRIDPEQLKYDADVKSPSGRKFLGQGGLGVVYAGHWQAQPVAIKTLHATTPSMMSAMQKEAAMMMQVRSDYTVKLLGICQTNDSASLVMQLMPGGSLFKYLHRGQAIPWIERYRLAYEVAQGLAALHSQEMLHRDLKSMNVLLDAKGHARITDFGFSKLRGQITSVAASKHSGGTPAYKAPELVLHDMADSDSDEEKGSGSKPIPYSPYSDIYALGVILWELASLKIPFEGKSLSKIQNKIAKGKHEAIPDDCPEDFRALIAACLQMRPGKRPRTPDIVERLKAMWQAEQQALAQPSVDSVTSSLADWHFEPDLKAKAAHTEAAYQLLDAGQADLNKVAAMYQRNPVPGYGLQSVQVVYNPTLNRAFALRLDVLAKRINNPAFKPKWPQEKGDDQNQSAWRARIDRLLHEDVDISGEMRALFEIERSPFRYRPLGLFAGAIRGHDDDLRAIECVLSRAHDFHTVAARFEAEVSDDQVEVLSLEDLLRLLDAVSHQSLVTAAAHQDFERVSQALFVVDYQDASHALVTP